MADVDDVIVAVSTDADIVVARSRGRALAAAILRDDGGASTVTP